MILILVLQALAMITLAQESGQYLIDSLKSELQLAKSDSQRVKLYYQLAFQHDMIDPKLGADYALQAIALSDSLGAVSDKAWGLNALAINLVEVGDYTKADSAYQLSLQLFEDLDDREAFARVLVNRGTLFNSQSLYPSALDCYQKALDQFKAMEMQTEVAKIMVNIGNIYGGLNDHDNAIRYYLEAIENIGEEANPTVQAVLDGNIALSHHELGDDSLSEVYYTKSLNTHRSLGNAGWEALTLGNLASLRYDQNRYNSSAELYQEALEIYRSLELDAYITWILSELGMVELERANALRAIGFCEEALAIAEAIQSLDSELHACECLALGMERIGNYREASRMHKRFIALDDSLKAQQDHDQVVRMMMQRTFEAQVKVDSLQREEEKLRIEMSHQKEVSRKDQLRNVLIGGGALLLVIAIGFYNRWRYVSKAKNEISREKVRSENLLLNILPASIADELKEKGSAEAREFDKVTILFTDFKDFTAASSTMTATDLVAEINACFEAFDRIVEKHRIEKIKTIGDAYMCAGGLPGSGKGSVKNTVLAALEMQEFMIQRKEHKRIKEIPAFEMRVGIHTGSVVAGIVGVKKFQYDIWGDAVNIASRMESSGDVGRVNISEATFDLIKDYSEFHFTPRGELTAKGKGKLKMYFVQKVKDSV